MQKISKQMNFKNQYNHLNKINKIILDNRNQKN